jgi:hypothetical protein
MAKLQQQFDLELGFALIIVSLVQMVAQRLGNGFANMNGYHVGKITQRCQVGLTFPSPPPTSLPTTSLYYDFERDRCVARGPGSLGTLCERSKAAPMLKSVYKSTAKPALVNSFKGLRFAYIAAHSGSSNIPSAGQ